MPTSTTIAPGTVLAAVDSILASRKVPGSPAFDSISRCKWAAGSGPCNQPQQSAETAIAFQFITIAAAAHRSSAQRTTSPQSSRARPASEIVEHLLNKPAETIAMPLDSGKPDPVTVMALDEKPAKAQPTTLAQFESSNSEQDDKDD